MAIPDHTINAQLPAYGQVNQTLGQDDGASLIDVSPVLYARKGRLFLFAAQRTEESILAEIYRRYYEHSCFDVLPTLSSALCYAYAQTPEARQALPVAMVVQGLSINVVAVREEAVALLVRSNHVEDLLLPRSGARQIELPDAARSLWSTGLELFGNQRRLYVGDAVVFTTRQVAKTLDARQLQRIVRDNGAPQRVAQVIARAAERRGARRPPVSVVRIPGFSPIAEIGPARKAAIPDMPSEVLRPEPETSPIWWALLIAVVAIGVALWFGKPDLEGEDLSEWLYLLLVQPTEQPADVGDGTPMPTLTVEPDGAGESEDEAPS
jgi:hypothetical protein